MVRRLTIVGLVVVLGGCFGSDQGGEATDTSTTTFREVTSTTTPPTTTVPELWGEEAFQFFEALRYVVPDRVGFFYSPTVILEGSPMRDSPLEEDLGDLEVVLIRALRSPATERLFLASDQAALEGDLAEHLLPGLWICEVVDGRIVRVALESLQGFEGYWRDPDPLGPRLGALHKRYFSAWTSGDADRVADLYQPGAIRTDGLFGSTRRFGPNEEVGGLPVETLVGDSPRYQALQTTGDLDGDGRFTQEAAVFTVEEWREEASAAHVRDKGQ